MVAARAVDPDAIAASFAPTATLFEPGTLPVETRAAIRAFMASFPGVRVEVATATPETIEVFGDVALLWGSRSCFHAAAWWAVVNRLRAARQPGASVPGGRTRS